MKPHLHFQVSVNSECNLSLWDFTVVVINNALPVLMSKQQMEGKPNRSSVRVHIVSKSHRTSISSYLSVIQH